MEKRIWKQNIRNLLIILLAVTVIFTGINVTAYGADEKSGTCGDNVTWAYNDSTKALTITGTGDSGTVTAPTDGSWDTIKTEATKVVITGNVTQIGASAFSGFAAATSITLPEGLKTINYGAFYNCSSLTSIVIPESVEKIIGGKRFNMYTSESTRTFFNCNNLSKTYVLGSETAIYANDDGTLEKLTGKPGNLTNAFYCALGPGSSTNKTKVYFVSNTAISGFLNSYSDCYTSGGYADITVNDDNGTEQDVALETLDETGQTVTAYFDGIPVANGTAKNWEAGKEFTVTAAEASEADSISGLPDDCDASDFVQVAVDEASKNNQTQPMKLTITAKTQNGDKKLKAGTYKFTVSPTTKETNETYTDLTLNLTVTKKTLTEPVQETAVTISNADKSYKINLDAPIYGGKYEMGRPSLEGTSDEAGQNFTRYCPGGIEVGSGDTGSYVKIGLDPNSNVNPKDGKCLTGYVNLKVKQSDYCDDYSVKIPVTIKGSPVAVAKDNITATDKTIEIQSTDSSCEYAVKSSADSEYNNWKNGADGKLLFEGLDSATNYTVAVRYKAVGTEGEKGYVSPTLPAATEVSTMQTAPADGEGYIIVYGAETIGVQSNYEVSESIDFNTTLATNDKIYPGKTYYVRKAATDTLPASAAVSFKLKDRPETAILSIDKSTEQITIPAGYSYKIGNDGKEIKVTEDTAVTVEAGKNITWWIPATDDAFASIPRESIAPSRGTITTPKVDYTAETVATTVTMRYRTEETAWKNCSANMTFEDLGYGEGTTDKVIYLRTSATADNYASETVTVTLKARPKQPTAGTNYSVNYQTEKITVNAGYEIREKDTDIWTGSLTENTTIDFEPGATYEIRKTATEAEPAGQPATIKIAGQPSAPTENDYNVDYTKETITVDAGYEIKKEGESSWTGSLTDDTTIEFTPGAKYEIRKKATDEVPAGAEATVTIPARGNAPEKVATPERSKVTNNGITIDVKKGLEYLVTDSSSAPASWTGSYKPEEDGEYTFENLEAEKTYYIHVRSAAGTNEPASESSASEAIKTKAAPEKAPVSNTEVIIKITDAIKNNTVNSISFGVKPGYEYVVSESANAPTEEDWSKLTNYYKEETEKTITINGLKAGTNYYIYVRKAGTDTAMPSEAAKVNTCTRPEVPKAAEAIGENKEITIDYANGKVKLTGDTYEVYVPTDDETKPDISEAGNVPKDSDMDINVSDDGEATIYIKKKGTGNVRLDSEWLEVKIKLNVTPDQVRLSKRGANQQLEARFSTQDMPYAGNITWKSSNNSVATVDDTGKVTAVGNGDAVITAKIGKFEAETKVTVKIYKTSGGSNTNPKTDVITTGDDNNKITSSPTEVNIETKTDASGNKVATAKVTVSQANRSEILEQAKYYKSKEIVLNVSEDDLKDAGSLEVTLDKTFIDSILNDTDAKLTIKTPEGDRTFTQKELKELSEASAGDTITINPAEDELKIAKANELTAKLELIARSSKTTKRNTKVVLKNSTKTKDAIKELEELGFTVKYRFYRSTKKASGYKRTVTKDTDSYTNTIGKKRTKYYYKVRVMIYDADGNLVTRSEFKQCKYACRIWSK